MRTNDRMIKLSALAAAILCLAQAGCKENAAAPAELPLSQAPQAVEMAFKDAKPELKIKAIAAIAALKENKADNALYLLQELSIQAGLTPRQRETAAGSMLAANSAVQTAAANGDRQASALVQYRRMNK